MQTGEEDYEFGERLVLKRLRWSFLAWDGAILGYCGPWAYKRIKAGVFGRFRFCIVVL